MDEIAEEKCPKCKGTKQIEDKVALEKLKEACNKFGAKKMCGTKYCANVKCKTSYYINDKDVSVAGHDPFCDQLIKSSQVKGSVKAANVVMVQADEAEDCIECPKCKTKIKLI
jgi:hypothetical protein